MAMTVKERIERFEKLGFGMFIHFGLYSVIGKGEWYKFIYKDTIDTRDYEALTDKFNIKKCYRDLGVVVFMTVWALVGNYVYNGSSEGYSHFFNWFFVVQDPFNMFPEQIAPFLMPVLNIALFFGVEMLIHIVLLVVKRVAKRRGLCYSQN